MNGTTMRRLGAALALGALASACAKKDGAAGDSAAATTGTDTTAMAAPAPAPAPAAPALGDSGIVTMIGLANASEIAAGKTAQSKATDKDVKAYAADMVKDHTTMQKMADSLSKANPALVSKGTTAADSAKAADKASADSLNATKKGHEWDHMYMAQQIAAHQHVLDALNGFSTSAQDAGLKTMIQGAIPQVQAHLDRAKQIDAKLAPGPQATAAGDTNAAKKP